MPAADAGLGKIEELVGIQLNKALQAGTGGGARLTSRLGRSRIT
jgi:hypothetical protein